MWCIQVSSRRPGRHEGDGSHPHGWVNRPLIEFGNSPAMDASAEGHGPAAGQCAGDAVRRSGINQAGGKSGKQEGR